MKQSFKDFVLFMRTTAFDISEIIMGIAVVVGFLGSILSLCYAYQSSSYNSQPQNWVERTSIVKDYEDVKTVFNNQKWAVINAYNNQIKNISANGLKTEASFKGLGFKADVFKSKIDAVKNDIYMNHENSGYDFDNAQKAEISSLFDKLNDRVNTKMAKIKAFYDARVRSIYATLKNRQKVKFASLAEYKADKSAQFSNKDFDAIGSLISKNLNIREIMLFVPFSLILLIVTTIAIIAFVREAIRLGKNDRLEKSGYYDKLYA